MPIYEYVCEGCGHAFELLIRADQQPQCPQCGGGRLDKQFSVPNAPRTASSTAACRDLGICDQPPCAQGACGGGGCPLPGGGL